MDWEGGRSIQDMERALFPSPEPGDEVDSKTPAAMQGQGRGMRQGHGIIYRTQYIMKTRGLSFKNCPEFQDATAEH